MGSTAPQTKESFVVQAKHAGTRSYTDVAAAKPTIDKARETLDKVVSKHPDTSRFRLVKRTTTFTHDDRPVK